MQFYNINVTAKYNKYFIGKSERNLKKGRIDNVFWTICSSFSQSCGHLQVASFADIAFKEYFILPNEQYHLFFK